MSCAESTSTSEYKYMLFKDGLIKQGDIVTILNDNWLVLHEDISINDVYTKVIIRRLKFNINFNFEGDVIAMPSAIDDGAYKITGNEIATPDGRITLYLQENKTSQKIKKEQRFLIMGNAWSVVQKTNAEHGIVKIYADIGLFTPDDDKENEIADRWKYETKDNYIIKINNVNNTFNVGDTLQLDVTTTNNGEVVTVPLTYTSSDSTIANIDENGLINFISVGNVTVTAMITDDLTVNASIGMIIEEVVESATYALTIKTPYQDDDPDELWYGETYEYTVTKFVDNVEVVGNFIFALSSEEYATITETTDNSCKVTAKDIFMGGSVVLTITDDETSQIAIEKLIIIEGK